MRRRELAKEFGLEYNAVRKIIEKEFPGEDWSQSAKNIEPNLLGLYREKIKKNLKLHKGTEIKKSEKLKAKIQKKQATEKAKPAKKSKLVKKSKKEKEKKSVKKEEVKITKKAGISKKEKEKLEKKKKAKIELEQKRKEEEKKRELELKEKEAKDLEERKKKILDRKKKEIEKDKRIKIARAERAQRRKEENKKRIQKDAAKKISKKPEIQKQTKKIVKKEVDTDISFKEKRKGFTQKKKFIKKETEGIKKKPKRLISKDFDIDIDTELYELEHKKKQKIENQEKLIVTANKPVPKKTKAKRKRKRKETEEEEGKLLISENSTPEEIANFMDIETFELINKMKEFDLWLSPTQQLDYNDINSICQAMDIENYRIIEIQDKKIRGKKEKLTDTRVPIITVMGHIDHGKTTILDALRNTNIASGESGGITQNIGASYISTKYGDFCMIDTPGHSAFTAMRARGAKVCDMVILVVAADDGVQPQTIEAINHARSAKLPIIVVVNKIDKGNARIDFVKKQLTDYNLVDMNYGGNTIFVEVSALKKTNIEDVLEAIQLQALEMQLGVDNSKPAYGFVIESKIDKGRGPIANLIITNGTLHLKDNFVCGTTYGRVKMLVDQDKKVIEEILPGHPIQVAGFQDLPEPGDVIFVTSDEREAKEKSIDRKRIIEETKLTSNKPINIEDLFAQVKGEQKELKVIIKADVSGSLGVLNDLFQNFQYKDIQINVLHSAVGDITENDIFLTSSSNAIILGFKIKLPNSLKKLVEKENAKINIFQTVFEIEDFIKEFIEGHAVKEMVEKISGTAEIRTIFTIGKIIKIAGCYMKEGMVTRKSYIRVKRNDEIVHEGSLESLKRGKNDAKEVKQGLEFGVKIKDFNDIEEGDLLEFYHYEQ